MKISRQAYADMFGPTVGDKVRLADTELWIEVEKDFTTYGEEVKFGGGKVIRDGQGQSQLLAAEVVDTLITNALIEQLIFDTVAGLERSRDDRYDDAVEIFRQVCLDGDSFPTFLTLGAYSMLFLDE